MFRVPLVSSAMNLLGALLVTPDNSPTTYVDVIRARSRGHTRHDTAYARAFQYLF